MESPTSPQLDKQNPWMDEARWFLDLRLVAALLKFNDKYKLQTLSGGGIHVELIRRAVLVWKA